MRRGKLLKAVIIFLAISLITGSLASCSKKDEYGGIGDIDINAGEEKLPESPFTKEDNPFSEYTYRKVNFDCAKMTFDAPKGWKQTIVNQSCIRYDVPDDDPIFPGAVFYVKCDYDTAAVENDFDPFSTVASEFGKTLGPYITGLPYPYNGGRDVWIKSYSASDEATEPAFTSDKTAASIKVTKDVVLMDKVTSDVSSTSGFDLITGYFRWDDFPAMMETVVPAEWTENAKKIISYMISSAAYKKQTIAETQTVEYRNLSFVLPKEFEAAATEGNIFRSAYKDIKATSGMSIGVFAVNEAVSDLSVEYIQNNYSDALVSLLADPESLDGYYPVTSCMDYEGKKLADENFVCSAYVNIATKRYDYTGAGMQYGMSAMPYLDMFVVERNGKNYMIAALYTKQQEDVAMRIIKAAIQSLTAS